MISPGQAHELEVTLSNAGATSEFYVRLTQNLELAKAVVALVMNTVFQLAKIDRDMTGWELLEPSPAEDGVFEPIIHEFLTDEDKGRCGGEEMIKRAGRKGISSGLRHLEAMLREQEKIPVEWRKYILVSTEVWQGPGGGRFVWCLYWDGRRWCLDCYRLEYDFSSSYRLVASRK